MHEPAKKQPTVVDLDTLRVGPYKIIHLAIKCPDDYNIGADDEFRLQLTSFFAAKGIAIFSATIEEALVADIISEEKFDA
jgi:hypothetical protein